MALTSRPKKSVHHKKRMAQHHRQSKRYVKAYFPYLPMLMLVGVALAVNSLWSNGSVLGNSANFSADQLLILTNHERSNAQLGGLNMDPELTTAAQNKANDLVNRNYWSHTAPDGNTFRTVVAASGYQYQLAGENLAYGFKNAQQVVVGWMNSPEHRANLLNGNYEDVGFGIASSPNYLGKGPAEVVVAEYAQPSGAVSNITFSVNNPAPTTSSAVKGATELSSKKVSRIQLLTDGKASWSMAAASAVLGAAVMWLLVRNGLRIHRLASKGEEILVHHPWVDVAVVFAAMAGYVLTRTGGLIH
jgi:uncharacterized protein YkwD